MLLPSSQHPHRLRPRVECYYTALSVHRRSMPKVSWAKASGAPPRTRTCRSRCILMRGSPSPLVTNRRQAAAQSLSGCSTAERFDIAAFLPHAEISLPSAVQFSMRCMPDSPRKPSHPALRRHPCGGLGTISPDSLHASFAPMRTSVLPLYRSDRPAGSRHLRSRHRSFHGR